MEVQSPQRVDDPGVLPGDFTRNLRLNSLPTTSQRTIFRPVSGGDLVSTGTVKPLLRAQVSSPG
jgi:hypothetical protein